ncbi:MAG: O-antigen ligase family protein [Clostridiales bacterium]|jgi:O-antigen ligase|nr:O-antigen ligase family protein [Clostridiales bacterium]
MSKLSNVIDGSLFFRAVDAVLAFFTRFFSGSALIGLAGRETGAGFERSVTYKALQLPLIACEKVKSAFFADFIKSGFFVSGDFLKKTVCFLFTDKSDILKFVKNALFMSEEGEWDFTLGYGLALLVAALAPFLPTMVTAVIIAAAIVSTAARLLTDARASYKPDIIGAFISLYIFTAFFCAATSFTPASSMRIAALTSLFAAVYFLFAASVTTRKKLRAVVTAFVSAAAVTAIYGLYQKYSGKVDMTWVDKELFEGTKLRVFSVFGNPNVYGEYLLLAIPLAFSAFFMFKKGVVKIYFLLAGCLTLAALALTYSRGCYVAFAFGALVFALFAQKRLVTVFAASIFAAPFALPPDIINRLSSITNLEDSSTSYRLNIWQATLRVIKDFWPSGVGQGIDAFNSVYPLYAFNAVPAPHTHSLFMQIITETGAFGFLAFFCVIFSFFKTVAPFIFKNARNRLFASSASAAAIAAGVAAFLCQGAFDYVFYNYKVFMLFFMFLSIGAIYVKTSEGA